MRSPPRQRRIAAGVPLDGDRRAASRRFARCTDASSRARRRRRRRGDRRQLQRQSGFGARGDRRARRARRRRAGSCSATWARSATQGPAFHREIGAYARDARHRRGCFAAGTLAREAADAFGAGAEHFASVDALAQRVAGRRARRRHRARQGLALHADGARRRGADRRAPPEARTDAAVAHRMLSRERPHVQRLQLHHAARGARDDDGARHLVRRRPADDRVARRG